MVAGCPKCSARYRVDADRIGSEGAKLRCTKCSAVFLVRAPKSSSATPPEPAPASPVEAPAAVQSAPPTPAPAPEASSDTPAQMPDFDPARLVIVADPEEERSKTTAEAILGWGLTPYVVHDGVEAMLSIQRMLPAAVVLDAALPKMFGFQVCEVIKRNESLRDTRVVLVGAIHHQSRYRRDPADLYGADVYIEQPDLPDGLMPILEEAGMPMGGATGQASAPPAPRPEPAIVSEPPPAAVPSMDEPELSFEEPEAPPAPAPVVEEAAAEAGDEDPEVTAERERALRLARIAVSEMLLYSPDKFERAVREGNLEQVLDLEIQEARALLRQRICEEVRAETDFIIDELNRVAAERGGQGG